MYERLRFGLIHVDDNCAIFFFIQTALSLMLTDNKCTIELTDSSIDFDICFLIKTQCSVEVSARVFLSDWHVSQHPGAAQIQTHQTTSQATPHFSPLTAASVLCIPPLWWTGRLVKRGMSALIYSLPGEAWWRYLKPISVTTSPSCTLTGCSPPLPTADGYGFMSAEPVFSYWTYTVQLWVLAEERCCLYNQYL